MEKLLGELVMLDMEGSAFPDGAAELSAPEEER